MLFNALKEVDLFEVLERIELAFVSNETAKCTFVFCLDQNRLSDVARALADDAIVAMRSDLLHVATCLQVNRRHPSVSNMIELMKIYTQLSIAEQNDINAVARATADNWSSFYHFVLCDHFEPFAKTFGRHVLLVPVGDEYISSLNFKMSRLVQELKATLSASKHNILGWPDTGRLADLRSLVERLYAFHDGSGLDGLTWLGEDYWVNFLIWDSLPDEEKKEYESILYFRNSEISQPIFCELWNNLADSYHRLKGNSGRSGWSLKVVTSSD